MTKTNNHSRSEVHHHSQIAMEILDKLENLKPTEEISILLICLDMCFLNFIEKHYNETAGFKNRREFEKYLRATVLADMVKAERMTEKFTQNLKISIKNSIKNLERELIDKTEEEDKKN